MSRLVLCGLSAVALGAFAVPSIAQIVVTNAVIHPVPAGAPVTGAYMVLHNNGVRPVALTGASCSCAAAVMAHESTMDGGVMRMRPAPRVVVSPHGRVAFRPGGYHLMVTGLKQPLKAGAQIPMRLAFDGAPSVTVTFNARR